MFSFVRALAKPENRYCGSCGGLLVAVRGNRTMSDRRSHASRSMEIAIWMMGLGRARRK